MRVVEHDQHPAAVRQGPVQAAQLVQLQRDVGVRVADRTQHPGQRLLRRERAARVEPAQVDPDLAVRELGGDPARPVHRERGLADPRSAVEGEDHRRGTGVVAGLRQHGVQALEDVVPAGERFEVGRELAGRRPRAGRHRLVTGYRAATGEQIGVYPLELPAGVHAELLGDPAADRLVEAQRLRLPAAALEHHEPAYPQRLAQRVPRGQLAQLRQQVQVAAGGDVEVDPPFDADQVPLDQPGRFVLVEPPGPDPLERRAPPGREGRHESRPLHRPVRFGQRGVQQAREPQRVDVVGIDGQRVAGGSGTDQLGAEDPPQSRDVDLHRAPRFGRELVAPDRGDQAVDRHGAPARHRQHREYRAQPAGRQRHRPAVQPDVEGPQYPNRQGGPALPTRRHAPEYTQVCGRVAELVRAARKARPVPAMVAG
ncbi:MAG: hypothetical protein AUI10_07500 [Actinobacteria bacterium 13_2_20CM_2_72_6]|nr:MAG: hypothetical protein AUI10_07500 [Actinobacteria bacterium 13_2_20CM_2_72_6]